MIENIKDEVSDTAMMPWNTNDGNKKIKKWNSNSNGEN
jgi:hypothetical protein